jgi:peroxiredoxin
MSNFQLPEVDLYYLEGDDNTVKYTTTRELIEGKRTVIVSVPGAFTPTCSNSQVPDFEKLHDQICELGVDQIVVFVVNDPYVVRAWKKDLGVEKVQIISDGNGAFTEGMKALVAKTNKGMGLRSWRLALVVNENGVVEWAGVEQGQRANAETDPYEESTPERVIGALLQLQANDAAAAAADGNLDLALAEAGAVGFGS